MPPKRPGSPGLSSNPHSVKRRQREARLNVQEKAVDKAVKNDRTYRLYHARHFRQSEAYTAAPEGERAQLLEAYMARKWQER